MLGVRRALFAENLPRRALVVRVGVGLADADVARAVDEAILVDLATRAGWARSDAVVRERIRKGLGAVEDVSDAERRDRAWDRDRPPAHGSRRARSTRVGRAREPRRARPRAGDRRRGDRRVRRRAPRRVRAVPARVRFESVFLSRTERGDALAGDAARVAALLRAAPDAPPPSDASPLVFAGLVDEARLDALVGGGFGGAVARSPKDAWSAPIETPFGVYFVRVRETEPRRAASVDEGARPRSAAIREQERDAAVDREMSALRLGYDVAVERQP
ncbi:MAG: hypothetical protein U0414_24950 [Polyangiaceae bacterium]